MRMPQCAMMSIDVQLLVSCNKCSSLPVFDERTGFSLLEKEVNRLEP
jgi:hypothetical protein